MERALIAGGAVGLVCSILGVFVVLRGLSFLGDGISHAAFAGVALGLLLGFSPLGSSLLFCVLFALLVGAFSKLGRVREDASIGIFFSASMALGVFVLGALKRNSSEVMSYLFGSIVTVSESDMNTALLSSSLVLIVLLLFYKEFYAVVFDEAFARRSGMPARILSYALLVMMAVSVVSAVRIIGVVLVSSLLVAPAGAALQMSKNFGRVVLLSGLLGVSATIGGIIGSYYADTPPGATVVLILTALFVFAVAARSLKGKTA